MGTWISGDCGSLVATVRFSARSPTEAFRSKRAAKAIEQARAEAKDDNVETLKAAIHQLEQASHVLSRPLYATANAQAEAAAGDGAAHPPNGRPGGTAPAGREEDAIEAELEVK
jgi:hypothetical protein